MTVFSGRLLHFVCNKTTINLIVLLLILFSFVKFCEWQSLYDTTFRIIHKTENIFDTTEKSVNGNYYTKLKYEPPEPIDLVYTWVNGTDERLLEQMSQYTNDHEMHSNRFSDNNELMYSLRSIEKFAPWVRHIYIVTNGQIPSWLNLENPRISVVPHSDIVQPEMADVALPTFSSMAIEMMLHRIPNLSERFIYMNDDIFLGHPLYLEDMRSEQKGIYVLPTMELRFCADTCKWSSIGNGVCNDGCNLAACNFDGGDCKPFPLEKMFANGTDIEDLAGVRPDPLPAKFLLDEASLQDHYLTSLIHSHEILSRRYGFKKRKMIAHVGFLIDRNVMYDIEKIFPDDVRSTESHRFRHGRDSLQYALVYHEVLLNEKRERTNDEIFDEYDTDKDGVWTNLEIRYYLAKYHKTNVLKWQHVEDFCRIMRKCLDANNSEFSNADSVQDPHHSKASVSLDKLGCEWNGNRDISRLSRDEVFTCPAFVLKMRQRFATVRKYKATVHPDPSGQYTFNRVNNELEEAKTIFNRLRLNQKIFNCINNDIQSDKPDFFDSQEYKQIIELWQKFYFSIFPLQSEFELPHGVHNHFRYVDELCAWNSTEKHLKLFTLIGLVLSCFVVIVFICQHVAPKRDMNDGSSETGGYKNHSQYKPLLNSSSMQENA